jgi:hypothetical protein
MHTTNLLGGTAGSGGVVLAGSIADWRRVGHWNG